MITFYHTQEFYDSKLFKGEVINGSKQESQWQKIVEHFQRNGLLNTKLKYGAKFPVIGLEYQSRNYSMNVTRGLQSESVIAWINRIVKTEQRDEIILRESDQQTAVNVISGGSMAFAFTAFAGIVVSSFMLQNQAEEEEDPYKIVMSKEDGNPPDFDQT